MAYEPELERLERRYQDDPARNFAQLAEAYRRAGRLDDALTMLQGHLTERPNYVSGLVVLGRCLLDQQNDVEARETFERVLGVDSEHIIALRALGEIAERAGDPDGARRWFARLLDVDPMNDDAEQALHRLTGAVAAPAAEPTIPEFPEEAAGAPEPVEPEPPVTFPVPAVEEAPRAGEARETVPPTVHEPPAPEFHIEQSDERFMPRPSGAHPRDVETIGDLEFTSRLKDAESPIGAVPDTSALDELPTGEREVDLGFADVRDAAGQLADEGPGRAPGTQADLGITAFDDALGWGAGDRISRQISERDLEEIEGTHEETVAPVSELPGLEQTEMPHGDTDAAIGPVEGLEDLLAGAVQPLPGLAGPSETGLPAEEPVHFVEPAPASRKVVSEEVVPAVPEVLEESEEATMDASGELVDRATAERRASLIGLPLLEGAGALEPDEPLVLEAEPEPVVTETMAELYVRQGLPDEARDVYERLLAQRPGDARLKGRLAELTRQTGPSRAAVQYDAARSGGQSARAMMMAVLAARPAVARAPAAAGLEAAPSVTAPRAADSVKAAAPARPALPEPMEEAFSEERGDAALGAPTQPADDEVSLSAIFGESPSPGALEKTAPSRAVEVPTAAARAPGGFSFDEFFGKPAGTAPAGGRPHRDTLSDDEGEEAFRDWLKGLKG
jgi:tetratricopeptide (TPR) repeat protein